MAELKEERCNKGVPLRSLWTASEARMVKHFLNTFEVRQWDFPYTQVDRRDTTGQWVIYIPRTYPGFSCKVYLGGKLYQPVRSKAWIRVLVNKSDSTTVTYNDGPAPDPFPPNEEWFEVANTYGDIHVDRF